MGKVLDIMTTDVKCCGVNDTLEAAARLMWDHDCGCVPVVDDKGAVAGMLTDRDICMATYTQGRAPSAIPAHAVMSREVCACAPGDSLADAERLMQERQIRRLPVLDSEGRLVGILSLNDLARAAARRGRRSDVSADEVETTLAAVCQPRSPQPSTVA